MGSPTVSHWEGIAQQAQAKYHIPASVLLGLVQIESSGREGLTSSTGAKGLTQFEPGTAREYGVNVAPGHAESQIFGAAHYLTALGYHKDPVRALASYNAGPGNWGAGVGYAHNVLSAAKGYGHVDTAPVGASAIVKAAAPKSTATGLSTASAAPTPNPGLQILAQHLISEGKGHSPLFTLGVLPSGPLPVADPAALASSTALARAAAQTTSAPKAVRSAGRTAPSASAPAGGSVLPKDHSQLFELIHNTGNGPGFGVKNGVEVNGSQVFSGVWAGHRNHVHVAAGPNTVVVLGKLAQSMGLHVGENPHFGGVNPVHVPGSYHYKGEAIDVSGSDSAMNAFARRVEQLFRLKS